MSYSRHAHSIAKRMRECWSDCRACHDYSLARRSLSIYELTCLSGETKRTRTSRRESCKLVVRLSKDRVRSCERINGKIYSLEIASAFCRACLVRPSRLNWSYAWCICATKLRPKTEQQNPIGRTIEQDIPIPNHNGVRNIIFFWLTPANLAAAITHERNTSSSVNGDCAPKSR